MTKDKSRTETPAQAPTQTSAQTEDRLYHAIRRSYLSEIQELLTARQELSSKEQERLDNFLYDAKRRDTQPAHGTGYPWLERFHSVLKYHWDGESTQTVLSHFVLTEEQHRRYLQAWQIIQEVGQEGEEQVNREIEAKYHTKAEVKAEVKSEAKAQGRYYCEALIANLMAIAGADLAAEKEHRNTVSDEVNRYLYPLFDRERPALAVPFQHNDRVDDKTRSTLGTFALLLFGTEEETDHENAFGLGAIYERVNHHPSLGRFLLCAALAAWRMADVPRPLTASDCIAGPRQVVSGKGASVERG